MIIGLGETGLSFARFLSRLPAEQQQPVVVMDDSPRPERIESLRQILPAAQVTAIDAKALCLANAAYVSPGVPLASPSLKAAMQAGIRLYGDVCLFGELAQAPIIGITGTNGKSTVTDLVNSIASRCMDGVRVGGNIGTPCLDILDDEARLYVLEVSSYQLELASSIACEVAVVLNLAPDHLDRYESLESYYETKLSIYRHCRSAVINRDLAATLPAISTPRVASFGLGSPDDEGALGMREAGGVVELTLAGQALISSDEVLLQGNHNLLNIQAALATSWLMGFDMDAVLDVIRGYGGLPHRSQVVGRKRGVSYINDSKATNPAAMIAAVRGQANGRNIHLIAGGVTKSADFSQAAEELAATVKSLHLIGESRVELRSAFEGYLLFEDVQLEKAVVHASELAEPGDVVLLAPGCASFDQFRDYVSRGIAFERFVEGLL